MDNYAVIDYYNFMGNYTAMDTYVAVMDNKTYSDLSTRYYNFPSDFKLYLTASVVVLSMVIIMALIVLIFHIAFLHYAKFDYDIDSWAQSHYCFNLIKWFAHFVNILNDCAKILNQSECSNPA